MYHCFSLHQKIISDKKMKKEFFLTVFVQTRASKNKIVGWYGDKLKVQITAPPVDGKANECLREFLAEYFGVAKSKVKIIKGQSSRTKLVKICEPKLHREIFTP